MNKKFLSAILFGALMVTSTGTFVSCKDYDDDIDAINKELTDVKSQIAALQAKVDAGKWITSVSSNAAGVTINLSDGSSLNITNGKDGQNGAQGEAGKDGKDGSVVEVKDGVLYINGEATEIKVAEEAPAAKPCVKLSEEGELMILEGDDYVGTGIKACGVVAVKENGVWTITTADGESIVVPGAAALTGIAIEGEKNLYFNYGKVAEATPWGWSEDGGKTFDEEMEAGFYTRLSQDVIVLLNPAEADGTMFNYTFKNSKGEDAGVKFFEEARKAEDAILMSRTSSSNGLWTLPAAVSKFEATSINELRNELYLKFKQNNGPAYAMTLEATDLLGNTAVRSGYDYTITLQQAAGGGKIYEMKNCEIAQVYYPSIVGPVYDYKIRVRQTAANLRLAKAFGIEIIDDKGFIANNDAAVLNAVEFEYTYVTINGNVSWKNNYFKVTFTDGLTVSENLRAEEWSAPLDATLANAKPYLPNHKDFMVAPMADRLYKHTYLGKDNKDGKIFVISHTYDLSTVYAQLSDEAKMLFNESMAKPSLRVEELIGGEAGYVPDNYNAYNRNALLQENISIKAYDADKKQITLNFYVSENWLMHDEYGEVVPYEEVPEWWKEYTNFQLNTAYQYNITVLDAWNGSEIAVIELPFEFTKPTMDITRLSGEFSDWGTVYRGLDKYGNEIWKPALYVYGYYDSGMRMPLYDSFDAWMAKDKNNGITNEFQKYVPNAEYYKLYIQELGEGNKVNVLGETSLQVPLALDNKLDYSSYFTKYLTYAGTTAIKAAAAESDKYNAQKELMSGVEVSYKHYGVYLVEGTTELDEYNRVVYPTNGVIDNDDFYLVYASWIKHSNLEMADDEYVAERGSHVVFITNDDLNFTTPKGDNFYLFNDVNGVQLVDRATINSSFNELTEHPFTTVKELFTASNKLITAKPANGDDDEEIEVVYVNENTDLTSDYFNVDLNDGEVTLNLNKFVAEKDKIQVYNVRSIVQQSKKEVATGVQQEFQGGIAIVLPKNWADYDTAVVTLTIKDKWGYENSVDINVTKLD